MIIETTSAWYRTGQVRARHSGWIGRRRSLREGIPSGGATAWMFVARVMVQIVIP